jgi:hypothetical protein
MFDRRGKVIDRAAAVPGVPKGDFHAIQNVFCLVIKWLPTLWHFGHGLANAWRHEGATDFASRCALQREGYQQGDGANEFHHLTVAYWPAV